MKYRLSTICFAILFLACSGLWAGGPEGTWEGVAMDGSGAEIAFSVTISKTRDGAYSGTIDVVEQGISALALQNVTWEGHVLKWVIPIPDQSINCEAKVDDEGTAKGSYSVYGGGGGSFTMKRAE